MHNFRHIQSFPKMKLCFCALLTCCLCQPSLFAQNTPVTNEITSLLTEFLQKADQADMHDRFWAEDLVYTSSGGERFGKERIMQGLESTENPENNVTYSSDKVEIKDLGNVATLTFQLIANTSNGEIRYWNSGTFMQRKGLWRAIVWQATTVNE